jgi:uncharacterized membrane protein
MEPVEKQPAAPAPKEKAPSEDRLIMLCDGVFAIAMTLLVLEIKLPANASLLPPSYPNIRFFWLLIAILPGIVRRIQTRRQKRRAAARQEQRSDLSQSLRPHVSQSKIYVLSFLSA